MVKVTVKLRNKDLTDGKVGKSSVSFVVDHDTRDSVQADLEALVAGWRKHAADKRKAGK